MSGLRLLALYPGLNPEVNDVFFVLKHLVEDCNADILVITQRANRTKSVECSARKEKIGRITIIRPFRSDAERRLTPFIHSDLLLAEVRRFAPEVVLCSEESNLPLAIFFRRAFKPLPIILLTEYAGHFAQGRRITITTAVERLLSGIPLGRKSLNRWTRGTLAGIVSCWPFDSAESLAQDSGLQNAKVIPWASETPVTEPPGERNPEQFIFAGALTRNKNVAEFERTVPLLFDHTPAKRFVVIGSGIVGPIKRLQRRYGSKVVHVPGLPRATLLQEIGSSYFGYTPAVWGSWGFILDCWAMGTPVLATHNDFGLRHGRDCILAPTSSDAIDEVRLLYADPGRYRAIVDGALRRYNESHRAETAARSLGEVLRIAAVESSKSISKG